jgi:hypothetical protein
MDPDPQTSTEAEDKDRLTYWDGLKLGLLIGFVAGVVGGVLIWPALWAVIRLGAIAIVVVGLVWLFFRLRRRRST